MKNLFKIGCLSALLLLAGCSSYLPKKVEFFQDKVQAVPEQTAREHEVQKQTAQRAAETALKTLSAAQVEQCPPVVTEPAEETVVLTRAVSTSLGPPLHPATEPSKALAVRLETAVAKLSERLEDFKKDNDKNTGKKIEDTGLFQVPYFVWVGGTLLVVSLLFIAVRIFLAVASISNPAAAVAVGGLKVASGVAAKGLQQVIHGGEAFKDWVSREITDTETKERVLEAFIKAHMSAQDQDVQSIVKATTR